MKVRCFGKPLSRLTAEDTAAFLKKDALGY